MMPSQPLADPIVTDTLLDDVLRLAGEYAKRAQYVEHSNPRAASVHREFAKRLYELAKQHSPTTDEVMKELKST